MNFERPTAVGHPDKLALTFPGQGSFRSSLLRELHTEPPLSSHFDAAEAATRRLLGYPFLPIVTAAPDDRAAVLAASPGLDQLGIFLTNVVLAQRVLAEGHQPHLLIGHSFGELSALAAGGCFSIEAGLEIVCHRVKALGRAPSDGRMAALSCDAARALSLLEEAGSEGVELAVLNSPRQTVVSGPRTQLEALAPVANSHGVLLTLLQSRYPFHSATLAGASAAFREALRGYELSRPEIPVLASGLGRPWREDDDLGQLLSAALVTQLDFKGIVQGLYEAGFRTFVECGGGDVVTKLVAKNLPAADDLTLRATGSELPTRRSRLAPSAGPVSQPVRVEDGSAQAPVAIVSMGCVLPGAEDPDNYWELIQAGRSGIIDLAAFDPNAKRDFVAGSPTDLVSDKTYTLLNGAIRHLPYDPTLLAHAYDAESFARLTRGQQILALATAQTRAGFVSPRGFGETPCHCILGSTADGCEEHDNALVLDSVLARLERLGEPQADRRVLEAVLGEQLGVSREGCRRLAQHRLYGSVLQCVLSAPVGAYVVDGACASSLYAIDLGVKALREGRTDLVLAGGVFAAGPANNVLFAQFRGLTANSSRPLDAAADGVVFGDGAALVLLKRLPDALADGDAVHAVIRGSGLASDGKSPAVNVPQVEGQVLAMTKALKNSAIGVDTLQYVEAHATSTPAGDAVELASLGQTFEPRDRDLHPIRLGSVKALTGHTGWVSGAASVIKVCHAFAAGEIPAQHNYETPNPAADLDAAGLEVPRQARPWPPNVGGLPRRAGVNGFGFGGVNAHLLLEEFDLSYHRRLCERFVPPPTAGTRLAVVAAADLIPASGRLDRDELSLPPDKLLLPDVTDHMDVSQYLAGSAAEQALAVLPADWVEANRDSIGVVLGLSGKTERGVLATERIYADRLRRLCGEWDEPREAAVASRSLGRALIEGEAQILPSGPYTLSGLMPNVAAGRVASLFDLNGPNLVVDDGEESLFRALEVAHGFLVHGDCSLVLAGALEAPGSTRPDRGEGAGLLALTTVETAGREGLTVLCTLEVGARTEYEEAPSLGLIEATRQLLSAVDEMSQADGASSSWRASGSSVALSVAPAPRQPVADSPSPSATFGEGRESPIYAFTPQPVASPAALPATDLAKRRVLFLIDRVETWRALQASGALAELTYAVACPSDLDVDDAVRVDLTTDELATLSASRLDDLSFDTIVPLADLGSSTETSLLLNPLASECRLLDLLFVVCRHSYARIRRAEVALAVLCVRARSHGRDHPATGLLSGFVKSLARELPDGVCRMVITDCADLEAGLGELALELGQGQGQDESLNQGAVQDWGEALFVGGERFAVRLAPLRGLAKEEAPYLDADSVVLVTGGARGVTAVLAEELLSRFGCTVVALGRTSLDSAPGWVTEMDEAAFADFEADYYRQELTGDDPASMRELKQRYARLQALNELSRTIARLERAAGVFAYRSVDLNDGDAVRRLVNEIHRQHGRLDLVVHGAGLQDSRILPKKSLGSFRRIVSTKLGGLAHLYRACVAHRRERPVHFHLLTSAFSYMGNDGQPDYGAANEALNRIATSMNACEPGAHWSTLAWLGWAGIGMTRGSEFAALAAGRGLRGVTRQEGRSIFTSLMDGPPANAVNVLMADGELEGYRVPIVGRPEPILGSGTRTAVAAPLDSRVTAVDLSMTSAPFLSDHRVGGVPTVPGAVLIGMAAEAAHELRPQLKIVAFEDTHFARFVRAPEGRDNEVRIDARVLEESDGKALVRVRVLSDTVHETGLVLEKDAVLSELRVRLAEHLPRPPAPGFELNGMPHGTHLPDPYVMAGSPVQLEGPFRCLRQLVVDSDYRKARYRAARRSYPPSRWTGLLTSALMVDAFWRFATVQSGPDRSLSVYVPERCAVMRVYFDYLTPNPVAGGQAVIFGGTNPTANGEQLLVGPIEARDTRGSLLLSVEGGVCRRFGTIAHAY